ncbi:class E sortase [Candidatus Saccharibacteria bacterium]|nr:class E sortase [Candidatus Saccharibacteria bacterium]
MNPENGGLSSEDRQRQTASEIARRRVLAAYENTGKLKDSPVSKTTGPMISNEEWKKYHSAWQNYYQKYYSEYYSNAAKQYVAKEKLKAERDHAEKKSALEELSQKSHGTESESESILRKKIRKKASDSAVKIRHRKKLIPIFAGFFVVLLVLFLQYNRLIFAPIAAYVSPGEVPDSELVAVDPTISTGVSADPKLIIPKLNIDVPVHFGISLDEVDSAMTNGVAHYRIRGASAFPGEIGNTVITGHSAGDVYSNNQYKFIFSGLERLETGDLIYINYNSTRYTYRMTGSQVIEPTDVEALRVTTDKPILTLITCTPLGTSRYRLLIFAEQISPNPDGQTASEPEHTENNDDLPANEPSMFEKFWNWLTGNN